MKVSNRLSGWHWILGTLMVLLLGFGFRSDVQAELAQVGFASTSQQNHLNARAVAYSPSRKLIHGDSAAQDYRKQQAQNSSELPNMSAAKNVHAKKEMFFSFLLPLVENENEHLRMVRQRLVFIQDHVRWGQPINIDDNAWLCLVCEDFKVGHDDFMQPVFWENILRRVDEVPENLVLVQAANESAWGTSRFAREGNNLFGQWCFYPNCGLVPLNRPAGATYQVAQFDSVGESVRSYMHNLNTGGSYTLLRDVRAEMRGQSKDPDASQMAGGLISYSERGVDYVNEIRSMLRHNEDIIANVKSRIDS